MRIKRRLPVLLVFLLFVAAVFVAVQLRKHAPPEPARLLPGADGFIYVDLKWMRYADVAGNLPQVPHDADYEQFIQATGFQFERDLKEAAMAIHYSGGTNGPETRFSYVFVAKIDGDKLRSYLKTLANKIEDYRSISIFSIPLENRILRVAVLGTDTVAISNHNDPAVIRGIIERSRKLASPFGGPALLRQFYKYVPITSLAWAILRVPPGNAIDAHASQTIYGLGNDKASTVVASVTYRISNVHFKAEAFTQDEKSAHQLAEQADNFLGIFRAAEISVGAKASDPDMQKAIESLKVEQKKERAVLTATVPLDLIRKLVAQAPAELGPQSRQ